MGKIINFINDKVNDKYSDEQLPDELIEAMEKINIPISKDIPFFWKELPTVTKFSPAKNDLADWDAQDFKQVVETLQDLFPYDPDYAWDYLYSCIQRRANEITDHNALRSPIKEQDIIRKELNEKMGVDIDFYIIEKWLVGFIIPLGKDNID